MTRRELIAAGAAPVLASCLGPGRWRERGARPDVRVTEVELLPVRATARTVWLFVRLRTDAGPTGLGEASDAFGFANTTAAQAREMEAELRAFAALAAGCSPLEIAAFRQRGWARAAAGGLVAATAFSAVEQALWDLTGKLLERPVCDLLGGALRDSLPVYASVNRATRPRTPEGFAASARAAAGEGFRAVKLAPFDGFDRHAFAEPRTAPPLEAGIACVAAVRDAVGAGVEVMVDAHGLFDVPLAIAVAERLEPHRLAWYEEPVAPERTEETLAIRRAIRQPMAAGELLFGARGFAPLCRSRAVDVIMPDVKHCGGLLELTRIAALAELDGIAVAPHNPSGPVATAATVHACAGLPAFRLLELQWGEVPWRGELVTPPESFAGGRIAVPRAPGFGIELDERAVRAHPI
jgi:galactonate dehydratase